ncbi:MAG: EF-hand domain-containing protein [Kiloniellales bacterium]
MKLVVSGLALSAAVALAMPAAAQNSVAVDQVYSQLDANADGELSASEMRAMAGGGASEDARIGMMIVMLDADGSGALSKEEFSVMMGGSQGISDAQAQRLFDHFDSDASGGIDHLEGRAAMAQMQSGMTEDQMDEALIQADANGDGLVDYEEFRKAGM